MSQTPTEIAHGAMDRLCDYDAWDAPGDYDSTADRIGEFMREFVGIAAARLAGAVLHGEGSPHADQQERIRRPLPDSYTEGGS